MYPDVAIQDGNNLFAAFGPMSIAETSNLVYRTKLDSIRTSGTPKAMGVMLRISPCAPRSRQTFCGRTSYEAHFRKRGVGSGYVANLPTCVCPERR